MSANPNPSGTGDENNEGNPSGTGSVPGGGSGSGDPGAPPAPRSYDPEEVAKLIDENAKRRIAAKKAKEEHEAELKALSDQIAEKDRELEATLALAKNREAALEAELQRRVSLLPETLRDLVRGSTVEEKLEHAAQIAASSLAQERPGVPPNPSIPAPGPRRIEPPSPATWKDFCQMPTHLADEWVKKNPEAYNALKKASGT